VRLTNYALFTRVRARYFARPETGLVGRGHFRSEARSRVLHEPLG
jgi:hypothetical protein